MNRILVEIERARQELGRNPVEDDGLTELGIAATPDSMCYVDAESANLVLDWIERVVKEEKAKQDAAEAKIGAYLDTIEADLVENRKLVQKLRDDALRAAKNLSEVTGDKLVGAKKKLTDALQEVKDSIAGA
jgi:hypothetical protein